ncbi:MAG: amidohydrolase [Cyclobacteriaceae bacterium]
MKNLRVAILQHALCWEQIDANLAQFEEQIWQIEKEIDLLVLPEMFTTGFTMTPTNVAEPVNGRTMTWMKQMAKQLSAVVMGSYVVNVKGTFRNRMYAVWPNGENLFYDKKHLFSLAGEDQGYEAGRDRVIFDIDGWRVMPQICYDLRFPVWTRSKSAVEELYEYDLLVYSANWPSPRVHAWNTLLQARAIENQCYVIGVNRTGSDELNNDYPGKSGVYDYLGEGIEVLDHQPGNIVAELDGAGMHSFRKRYPFQVDADGFDLS